MINEMILMKPEYFSKREAKRNKLENDASMIDVIEKEKADDLEAQYKRVFSVKGKTAQININGPLSPDGPDWIDVYFGYGGTAYKNIVRAAGEARDLFDKGEIENIIVRMNTPGGTVDGVELAHKALLQIGDIGIVKNDGMIASAGVWLASAFNRIEPTIETAQIGSIGVVATFADYTGYYDNFGIKVVDVTNTESPNKRPDILTKKGLDVIRRELDDIYNVFASKVTATRPITKKDIDSLKGEMLIAAKAVDFGLMDKPQNEDISDDAEIQNNNNETEVSKLSKKIIVTEDAPIEGAIIDLVTPAINAERERIYSLAKISSLEISDDLKLAIENGMDAGKYAVMQVEARDAKNKAEVEAANELRKKNKDEEISIPGNGDDIGTGEDSEENKKLDKMLDKNFKKVGGKK